MGVKAASTQKLSDGTTQWSASGFVATLRQLAPGVVYCTAAAKSDMVFIDEFAEALEAEIATHGRVVVFVNLLEATRLRGEARDHWAAWSKSHKQQAIGHFLVQSKLVEMGLSLIALFSGAELRSYSDIGRFEAAMREAAPKASLPKLRKTA